MISNRCKTMLLIIASVAVMACRCSGPAHAGSETTSGVEIAVEGTDIHGKTAVGATVMIFSAQYTAGSMQAADTVTADGSGSIAFTDLPAGSYNMFVYADNSWDSGAAFFNIPVGTEVNTVFADTEAFTSLRTVAGTVTRQGRPDSLSKVYIPGSPFYAETDAQGKFSFTGVPDGVYTIIVHPLTETDSGDKSFIVDIFPAKNAIVDITLELN